MGQIVMSRAMDRFDVTFDMIDKDLNQAKADISHSEQDNDTLVQLIHQLEEKSRAAERSSQTLAVEIHRYRTAFGTIQSRSPNVTAHDEVEDEHTLQQCTEAQGLRAQGVKEILIQIHNIQNLVDELKHDLRQARADQTKIL